MERLRLIERVAVREHLRAQRAQEPDSAVGVVETCAEERAAAVDRRGHPRRGSGEHRHPVVVQQPRHGVRDHGDRQSALLVRHGLLDEHDHAAVDVDGVAVVPQQLQILALGVEAERAAGIGVDGDLDVRHRNLLGRLGRAGLVDPDYPPRDPGRPHYHATGQLNAGPDTRTQALSRRR